MVISDSLDILLKKYKFLFEIPNLPRLLVRRCCLVVEMKVYIFRYIVSRFVQSLSRQVAARVGW